MGNIDAGQGKCPVIDLYTIVPPSGCQIYTPHSHKNSLTLLKCIYLFMYVIRTKLYVFEYCWGCLSFFVLYTYYYYDSNLLLAYLTFFLALRLFLKYCGFDIWQISYVNRSFEKCKSLSNDSRQSQLDCQSRTAAERRNEAALVESGHHTNPQRGLN